MKVIRSVLWWCGLVLSGLMYRVAIAVVYPFDKDPMKYKTGLVFRHFGKVLISLYPFWRLKIEGTMPPNPKKPYIVVSNHQSLVDIPIICCLSWDMKWLGKEELFKMKVLGAMMRAAKDIPVKRESKYGRATAMIQVIRTLQAKSSVMLFPEGTRSPDGRVYQFMEGIFSIAIERKIDILPLAIDGSIRCMHKNGWMIDPVDNLRLRVFEPVEIEKLLPEEQNAKALTEKIRKMIICQIAEWRQQHESEIDADINQYKEDRANKEPQTK